MNEVKVTWIEGDCPPKVLNKYIVTYEDGSVDTCIWMRNYSHNLEAPNYHWSNPRGKIVAYMELPKAYKGDN